MTANPETAEARVAAIRERHAVLAAHPWAAKPHQHGASGCRCLSCYDDPTGWQVDHPGALDCEELVAQTVNDFGRDRASCDAGPLLSYEEADALAHAGSDIGFLLEQLPVSSAVPDHTLRDRVAEALYDHNHPGWAVRYDSLYQDERDTYLARADAVLAVLPTGDRAALEAERDSLGREADRLRKDWVAMRDRAERAEADRATVLREAADAAEDVALRLHREHHVERSNGAYDVMNVLLAAARDAVGVRQPDTETQDGLRCVCGDPVQLMDDNDPTSWIHSPGSDTRCLDARPRCPLCQMPHDQTPSMRLVCASILASIRAAGQTTDGPESSAGGSGAADETRGETGEGAVEHRHTCHDQKTAPGRDWDCQWCSTLPESIAGPEGTESSRG